MRIDSPVEEAAVAARHRAAVGLPVDRLGTDDPLAALLKQSAAEARENGLTEAEIDAELAAYNAERRA